MKKSPSPQPAGAHTGAPLQTGEGVKDGLIRQIRQIYRDLNYRACGKPLEEYGEEELQEHLVKLQAGTYPWMRKPTSPPREKAVYHH